MSGKTVNRAWLLRQVDKGNVLGKCDYHYTDDYAGDVADNFGKTGWLNARIQRPQFEEYVNRAGNTESRCVDRDFREGWLNFRESDFKTKSGAAWWDDNGETISFLIHSNHSFTLRLITKLGSTEEKYLTKPVQHKKTGPVNRFSGFYAEE